MHEHRHDTLVSSILLSIAQEKKKSLKQVKKLFVVKNDVKTTQRFWDLLEERLPNNPYVGVAHCSACGRFDLDENEVDYI